MVSVQLMMGMSPVTRSRSSLHTDSENPADASVSLTVKSVNDMRESAESVPHGGLGKTPAARKPPNNQRRGFFESLELVDALPSGRHLIIVASCFLFSSYRNRA